MSITDQKPHLVTEQDLKAPWNGGKDGKYFRCYLCGHKFSLDEYYRFVFSNLGNVIVCRACDDDVIQKWTNLHNEWKELSNGKFWHFIIPQEDNFEDEQREFAREAREMNDEIKYWKDKALYEKDDRY